MSNMTENNEDQKVIPNAPLLIHAQYLKDFSFENPHAPETLRQDGIQPQMDMDIALDINKLEDEKIEHLYTVDLIINAKANRGDKVMFIAELKYGALVSIKGIDEKKHHPLLFIEVPHMTFPFARQALSDATQAGGFIPLQLNPVDFRALYLERFGSNNSEKSETEDSDKKAS